MINPKFVHDQYTDKTERAKSALLSIDPGCSRDEWVRIIMAAKSAGIAFEVVHEWSKTSDKYRSRQDCLSCWNSIKSSGGVTPSTLFDLAFKSGWMDTNERAQQKTVTAPHVVPVKKPGANVLQIWETCTPAPISHNYITKKQGSPDGLRIYPGNAPQLIIKGQNVAGWLVLPAWSGEQLQTLQFIPPNGGEKLNLPGASFDDGYFTVGDTPNNTDTHEIYIVEGIGQAWAANSATGSPAIVSFGSGRMSRVAKLLHTKNTKARLIIVPDKGKEADAAKIAASVHGFYVEMPDDKPNNYDVNDYLQEYGADALVELFSKTLEPTQAHQPLTEYSPDTGEQNKKPDWLIDLDAHVEQFNQTHASVVVGGKHRIMREVSRAATHDGRVNYEFNNRDDLSRVYDNTLIKVGEKEVYKNTRGIYANHLMAWAKNPNSRSYTGGVIFLPGRVPPPDYFNTWRGFSVDPKRNDALLTPIYGHMKDIVCAGHQDLYDYFIKWIAYTIQNPDKPAGAALVLRGEKGSGKGTIGHFLKTIWDNHGLHITSPKHLVGNFNAHLNDVCFLFADEAFFSGDHAAEGILKGLITEPSLMIERKGIDAITQPNYLKIFMATNSDWAVPATKDERRFCIMDVSSAHIGNREYFNSLWGVCHSKEVQAAFLYAMLNIDLTDFHTGDIPDSIGLREQRYHSMRPHQQWLADNLINGTFNALGETGNPDDWHEELSSDELFKKYVEWCDRAKIGEFRRVAQCVLGGYLGKIYEPKLHVGGRGKRGYIFGSLAEAIVFFEDYEKVNLNELV